MKNWTHRIVELFSASIAGAVVATAMLGAQETEGHPAPEQEILIQGVDGSSLRLGLSTRGLPEIEFSLSEGAPVARIGISNEGGADPFPRIEMIHHSAGALEAMTLDASGAVIRDSFFGTSLDLRPSYMRFGVIGDSQLPGSNLESSRATIVSGEGFESLWGADTPNSAKWADLGTLQER